MLGLRPGVGDVIDGNVRRSAVVQPAHGVHPLGGQSQADHKLVLLALPDITLRAG